MIAPEQMPPSTAAKVIQAHRSIVSTLHPCRSDRTTSIDDLPYLIFSDAFSWHTLTNNQFTVTLRITLMVGNISTNQNQFS